MSDSASRKSDSQTSKFAQSQGSSNSASNSASHAASPGIGDLSALQSEIENPASNQHGNQHSNPHSVGDMKNIDAAANSDVLEDITLLEEAFAEMEDQPDATDDDIPMLQSTIEEPSAHILVDEQDESHSIPVLDQEATAFTEPESMDIPTLAASNPLSEFDIDAEAAAPQSTNESTNEDFSLSDIDLSDDSPAEATDEPSMEPVVTTFDALDDQDLDALVSTPVPENADPAETIWAEDDAAPEPTAFRNSEPQSNTMANTAVNSTPATESNVTFSSIAENFNNTQADQSAMDEMTESKISDDVFSSDSIQSTIEDKIAQATGDTQPSGFNDIPLTNEHVSGLAETQLASGFVEDLAQSHFSTPTSNSVSSPVSTPVSEPVDDLPVGELVEQIAEPIQTPNDDAPKSMSIPFELHSQLSKKIDALVLDATMSLTSELENQLSSQLEALLGNAVESVLPKLIDQMANELREEVKGRVKHQLPIIVNDVLGKTRLS